MFIKSNVGKIALIAILKIMVIAILKIMNYEI